MYNRQDVRKKVTEVREINAEAFTYYVNAFSGTVFRTAVCFMKNKADADDIMQEVFLKLYTSGVCFESDAHAKAWLIKVTANMCKNMLKTPWKRLIQPIETAEKLSVPEKSDISLPEIMMKLKSRNRIVLYMHYFEGYTTREIAEILGIKENAVTSQLYRGRKQLKDLLLKEGYDEL